MTPPITVQARVSLSFACVLIHMTCVPLLAAQSGTASAPPPVRALGVGAGISYFDLSGIGSTTVFSVRAELEARRWLVLEASVGAIRPNEQFMQQRTYVLPDVQMQLQLPGESLRPYLGIGVGAMLGTQSPRVRPSASGAAGFRLLVPGTRIDVRPELRVRYIGRSNGVTADWTLGVAYRL